MLSYLVNILDIFSIDWISRKSIMSSTYLSVKHNLSNINIYIWWTAANRQNIKTISTPFRCCISYLINTNASLTSMSKTTITKWLFHVWIIKIHQLVKVRAWNLTSHAVSNISACNPATNQFINFTYYGSELILQKIAANWNWIGRFAQMNEGIIVNEP